jgi:transcriptional regulator with XRE-family HTH domain
MLFELLRHRRMAGLTQRQLAERAGVHHETVSRLERGAMTGSPGADTLRKLADALGSTPEQLFPELLGSSQSSPAA